MTYSQGMVDQLIKDWVMYWLARSQDLDNGESTADDISRWEGEGGSVISNS